uniref:TNF receptor-associated factor 1 n=1 Tax=Euleptes europaea TaxID=460621 RepID=UPI0025415C4F|nr:TNF receptor-associated factor 1 [Euleptes europaea]
MPLLAFAGVQTLVEGSVGGRSFTLALGPQTPPYATRTPALWPRLCKGNREAALPFPVASLCGPRRPARSVAEAEGRADARDPLAAGRRDPQPRRGGLPSGSRACVWGGGALPPMAGRADAPDPEALCSRCRGALREALRTRCGPRGPARDEQSQQATLDAPCKALRWLGRSLSHPDSPNPISMGGFGLRCGKTGLRGGRGRPQIVIQEAVDLQLDSEALMGRNLRVPAFSDAAVNKEISELSVRCAIPGCAWTGIMKALEGHQSTCEDALIPCHAGCGQALMRKKLAEHLQHECILSAVSTDKDSCRFSRIGCSFKGNGQERQEHEKSSMGTHLVLLLHQAKQLKGNLPPAVGGADSCLKAARALNGLFTSLQLPPALDMDSFPGLPLYEGESSWQALLRGKVVPLLDSKLRVFENIVSVLSKEMDASRQKIAAFRGQRGLDQDTIRGLELKIAHLQRCLAQKEVALGRLQQKLFLSAEASYDGVFLWKITDVHQKCYEAVSRKVCSLQSPAFYTARYGYKLCMRLYLNGEGRGKGTHMSLFLVLLRGEYDVLLEWPFTYKITFMLLDQNNGDHLTNTFHTDPTSPSSQRPVANMNEACGCPRFLSLAKLQSLKYTYLKDGTLFLKCVAEPSL